MTAARVLRRYAAMPVPRYTSYPTAADFSAVTPAEHASWLGRLPLQESASLYLHVPYCRVLCHYCGCHTKLAVKDHVIHTYRRALEAEIRLVAALLPGKPKVSRIAWGGGTPGIIGRDSLASVLDALSEHIEPEANMEHSIELDPRHVDATFAADLVALGVNRVSLGVQDLDPQVQREIGRIQPKEQVAHAVGCLRAAGLESINVDLIYGLPGQTVDTLRATCEGVLALQPKRVAFYGYAHLPERRANQKLIDATKLPSPAERFEQASVIATAFPSSGYVPIGIDHFALPDDPLALAQAGGRLHRNFQGYTDDDCPTVIAFGASAVSRLPDGYVQNIADNHRYVRAIETGQLATVRGCRLHEDDRTRARIIEALMCNFRVDLAAVDPLHDYVDELALLRPLAADGMLRIKGKCIEMTEVGRPIVRVAAAVFDSFRSSANGRFSIAV